MTTSHLSSTKETPLLFIVNKSSKRLFLPLCSFEILVFCPGKHVFFHAPSTGRWCINMKVFWNIKSGGLFSLEVGLKHTANFFRLWQSNTFWRHQLQQILGDMMPIASVWTAPSRDETFKSSNSVRIKSSYSKRFERFNASISTVTEINCI